MGRKGADMRALPLDVRLPALGHHLDGRHENDDGHAGNEIQKKGIGDWFKSGCGKDRPRQIIRVQLELIKQLGNGY